MNAAQQMIALVIFAWIGLASVLLAAGIAIHSLVQLVIFWVGEYLQMRRRA